MIQMPGAQVGPSISNILACTSGRRIVLRYPMHRCTDAPLIGRRRLRREAAQRPRPADPRPRISLFLARGFQLLPHFYVRAATPLLAWA